jgi:hypothetical protein
MYRRASEAKESSSKIRSNQSIIEALLSELALVIQEPWSLFQIG